ncbi:putative protein N(5)-glutamine methyltransferase [Nocardioides sp. YIM 152588]|uniref:putative protein N(5)-glutamine methyltransferase n=1 Tax=Nocardioides sp. YIM 152588 TaxID=3158259 RepID=UPI0032E368DF
MTDPAPPDEDALVSALRAAGCVFAEEEAAHLRAAAAGDPALLGSLLDRRVAGEPLEHVVGWVDFDGHRLALDPGVFIPRRRSTWLVELAAAALPDPGGVLVDLGCGSGALAAAVAHRLPTARIYAVDVSAAAVACAARNLDPLPNETTVLRGDLFEPLPPHLRGTVDVVVANLPYVPSAARALMPAESRVHEPPGTTDGGPDGLDPVRRAAGAVGAWLRPGGTLLVETGAEHTGQAGAAVAVLAGAGLRAAVRHDPDREATAVAGTARA